MKLKLKQVNIAQLIKKNLSVIFFLVIFSVLVFTGMTRHPFWADEGHTAYYGKTILKYGLPISWDGKNVMGQLKGTWLDKNLLDTANPWPEFYLIALSYKMFGINTFTARLPFALFSLISLITLYFFVKKISYHENISILTILLLSASVPFILYSFQCRYYALNTFASIAFIFSVYELTKNTKKSVVFTILSGIFLFYNQPLVFVSFYPAVILSSFFLKLNFKLFIKKVLLVTLIIGLFIIPWILILRPTPIQQNMILRNFSLINTFALFLRYAEDFNFNSGLPIVLGLLLIWIIPHKFKLKRFKGVLYIISTCILFIIFQSATSVQNLNITSHADIRYTMNIYPLLIFISAVALYEVYNYKKFIGFLLIIIFLFTNVLTLSFPVKFWLRDYINELSNKNYSSSTESVIKYLKNNSQPNQTVLITPDYNNEPVLFYLDNLPFINRIDPQLTNVINNNIQILPRYVYDNPEPPDWIVLFSKRWQYDSRPLPKNVNLDDYDEIIIPVFATDMTRPEMYLHSFYPIENFALEDSIFIYKIRK